MQRTLLTLALVLSIFSISAVTQQSRTRQKWEYKIEGNCYDTQRNNALGLAGWELAGFSMSGQGVPHCIFKRPLR